LPKFAAGANAGSYELQSQITGVEAQQMSLKLNKVINIRKVLF
jgi:hypothetical protein